VYKKVIFKTFKTETARIYICDNFMIQIKCITNLIDVNQSILDHYLHCLFLIKLNILKNTINYWYERSVW